MIAREMTVLNKVGLHARPAAVLVRESRSFSSTVELEKEGCRVSAKSITGVMQLAVNCGETVTVHVEGQDEQEAMDRIAELFSTGFGEEK